jgi:hypothetical protein
MSGSHSSRSEYKETVYETTLDILSRGLLSVAGPTDLCADVHCNFRPAAAGPLRRCGECRTSAAIRGVAGITRAFIGREGVRRLTRPIGSGDSGAAQPNASGRRQRQPAEARNDGFMRSIPLAYIPYEETSPKC